MLVIITMAFPIAVMIISSLYRTLIMQNNIIVILPKWTDGGPLGLDRYGSSRYRYILPADIFADTDILAPTYRSPIPIFSFWPIFSRQLAFGRYIGGYPCILADIWPIPIFRLADTDTNTDMADTDIPFSDTDISVSAKYIG
jgi:hypothetical protein